MTCIPLIEMASKKEGSFYCLDGDKKTTLQHIK